MRNFISNWKLHFALLPVYALVMATATFILFVAYCGLIQFGFWGPIIGVMSLWFFGGLFYAFIRGVGN